MDGRSGSRRKRPDKEWKAGPDNLWALRDGEYLLVECKSEVQPDRKEIVKDETGQMNNACAWFAKHYNGAKAKNIMMAALLGTPLTTEPS